MLLRPMVGTVPSFIVNLAQLLVGCADCDSCFISIGGFSVFAGVGERTREGNDLYREMIESGVIKLGDKQVFLVMS